MTGTAALTDVLPGPDGPLPLLILDLRPGMAVRSGAAGRGQPFPSGLLGNGLALVTTIGGAGPGATDVTEVGDPLARPGDGGSACPHKPGNWSVAW